MKVLMIIKKMHYSGAPKMFLWVAEKIACLGVDVTILTYRKNLSEEVPSNVKWIKLDLDGAGFFKTLRVLRQYMKSLRPDCCVSFLLDANILNILACLCLKTKSVVCERNDPFKPRYYKLKFAYPLFSLANGAVFQLPQIKDFYKIIKQPTAVIPNPVICRESKFALEPFEKRENVIVTVGRIDTEQKRHDLLIKAFAIFEKLHPEYCLHIYGNGHKQEDELNLKKLAVELRVQDKVAFKGVTNDPLRVMRSAKFFVLTSDFEGIPNSLVEAMSVGLPCISTDCRPGGAAFLIKNGLNGFLVPKGDIDQIAEKMDYIANHPVESDKMGALAREIASEYSEEKVSKLWLNYLSRLNNDI